MAVRKLGSQAYNKAKAGNKRTIVFENEDWLVAERGAVAHPPWRNFQISHKPGRRERRIKRWFYVSYNMEERRFANAKDVNTLGVFGDDISDWIKALAYGDNVTPPTGEVSKRSLLPEGEEESLLRVIEAAWEVGEPLGMHASLKKKGRHAPTVLSTELSSVYAIVNLELLRLFGLGVIRKAVKSKHSRVTGLKVDWVRLREIIA
jgi:hypothetical protein